MLQNLSRILLSFLFGCGCVAVFAQQPVKIMPMGDSNTRGTMSEPPGGYRLPLQQLLDSAGIKYDFVGSQTRHSDGMKDPEHEGFGGWRVRQLLEGREEKSLGLKSLGTDQVMDRYEPDVVLIMAGINDVFRGDKAEKIVTDMRDLLVALFYKKPDVKILLGNLLPVSSARVASGEVKQDFIVQTRRYNEQIPAVVAALKKLNYRIELVDIHSVVNEAELVDDVHPNSKAMSKMGRAWFEALMKSGFW